MRSALGYLLEIVGFGCIVGAFYAVSPLLALGVFGGGCIVGAQAVRPRVQSRAGRSA